jgi:hypothetical protein
VEDKECKDIELERAEGIHLAWFGIASLLILVGSLWISTYVYDTDPEVLIRNVLTRSPMALLPLFLMQVSAYTLNKLLPGESLQVISKDARAAAMLYAAMFISFAFTWAYN